MAVQPNSEAVEQPKAAKPAPKAAPAARPAPRAAAPAARAGNGAAPVAKPLPKAVAAPASAASAPVGAASNTPVPVTAAQPTKAAKPAPAAASSEEEEFDEGPATLQDWLAETPSWLASMVVHIVVLLAMALVHLEPRGNSNLPVVVSEPVVAEELEELEEPDIEDVDVTTFENALSSEVMESAPQEDVPLNPIAEDVDAAPMAVDFSEFANEFAPKSDLLNTVGVPGATGQGVGGRSGKAKGDLLKRAGGNDASEAAVARALRWLAAHQCPDGGWDFDLTACPSCKGQCKDSGSAKDARLGATGMALMPFLGAGQTHKEGAYKKTVQAGLYFMTSKMKNMGGALSMHESQGTMYSHGIGSIVLCEAYAMTQDRTLMPYAQGAINFIAYAQDPVGGGWRYAVRTPGDTSVVGWQIMALKSAHMAYLQVPPLTVKKANDFLNSVQVDQGSGYGYSSPANKPSTSAIGLLCRMYLGWKKDNPALIRGHASLAKRGPSKTDMYYNYYATQVMRHMEGAECDAWNTVMRDFLVASQSKKGHEEGSWFFSNVGHANERGGRLYTTSMATMILEVYYRHLPIYGAQSVKDEFAN